MSPRKPTHNISVINKVTGARGQVGAGWLNDNGTITLALNPMVHLVSNPDCTITLFPIDYKPAERPTNMRRGGPRYQPVAGDEPREPDPDNVPF